MKTFIASVVIFMLIVCAVVTVSIFSIRAMDELVALSDALPQDAESFEREYDDIAGKIKYLEEQWSRRIEALSYMMGYDILDRADEAAVSLVSAYKSAEAEEFLLSNEKFRDCVLRMRVFCTFSIKSFA